MTRKKPDYARRSPWHCGLRFENGYNPDCFDVGRKQAAELLFGSSVSFCFPSGHEWLVVSGFCKFGDDVLNIALDMSFRHLYSAADFVQDSWENELYEFDYFLAHCYGYDYEIWHLVDDGELWDEWELKVKTFRELAERKEEETRKLYSGELGVNVSAFLKHYATCQNVKRDMSEIVRIGRLITSSLGGNYELHDLEDYDRLLSSGSIWELFVYDGCTFHVWRFPSERDYLFFVERHEEMLRGFGSFVYRYLYGADGVFAYEDMQSDEGVKSIWESIPGGELDEDIVF